MKKNLKISCILSLIMVMAMLSCTTQPPVEQQEKNPLKGVWQLMAGEWSMQDTVYTFPSEDFVGFKSYQFLGETHYVVVGQDTAGDTHYAHTGPYRFTEDTYVVYFEIHKNVNSIGDSAVFKYSIEGDKWTISSDWLNEEWKRIE